MVHGGMKLVKFLLFLFNFIFWLTGLGLIVFGTVIKIQQSKYINFLGNSFLAASVLLIVAGCIIAVLGFFGCCGAIRENYCMTMSFAVLLGIIFILELAAGIASYVLRSDLEKTITKQVRDGMNNYLNDTHPPDVYTSGWNSMQQNLNCCGAVNYTDWEQTHAFGGLSPEGRLLLPWSCCNGNSHSEVCDSTSHNLHQAGCLDQMKKWAENNVALMGGVACGVAFIQILGIGFACCLSKSILKDYEEYYY